MPSASSTSGPRTCTASGATTSPPACSCCAAASSTSSLAIGIGSLVIFFLMSLVGYAGVKTGVPYPVLARASFGVWGANLPALVRAVVACFWYGAQTAAASGAIVALLTRTDALMEFHKSTHFLGHSGLEVICYVVVWALQLLIIQNGMETVRKFQDWAGPAVWVAMLVLAIGLCVKAGGFSFDHAIPQAVLLEKTKDAGVGGEPGSFWALMAVGATWVTYFAALYLNFCDFSRYAQEQGGGDKGNVWGLPVNLLAVLAGRRRDDDRRLQGLRRGDAAPGADLGQVRQLAAGRARRADLRGGHARHQRRGQFRLARPSTSPTCSRARSISRRAATSPPPSPSCSIRSRRGKAMRRASSTPSARTMGPLLGIILVDYYLIAKGNINVEALYHENGEYRYEGGWNVNALVADRRRRRLLEHPAQFHARRCRRGGAPTAGSSAWRSAAASTSCWRWRGRARRRCRPEGEGRRPKVSLTFGLIPFPEQSMPIRIASVARQLAQERPAPSSRDGEPRLLSRARAARRRPRASAARTARGAQGRAEEAPGGSQGAQGQGRQGGEGGQAGEGTEGAQGRQAAEGSQGRQEQQAVARRQADKKAENLEAAKKADRKSASKT